MSTVAVAFLIATGWTMCVILSKYHIVPVSSILTNGKYV
jgi:hypothetical protein